MKRLAAFLSVAFLFSGCAMVNSFRPGYQERHAQEERAHYVEEGKNRVVYTPLNFCKSSTEPNAVEFLLHKPVKPYKELGFISIYQKYSNETAADLLPFMRERAAKEGANAVILMEANEAVVGMRTMGGASAIGNGLVAGSHTEAETQGTLRGIAIAYEAN